MQSQCKSLQNLRGIGVVNIKLYQPCPQRILSLLEEGLETFYNYSGDEVGVI